VAEELTAEGADVESLLEGRSDPRQVAGLLSLWREHPQAVETAAIDCRYAGYVARQQAAAERLGQLEGRRIPDSLDYGAVAHLRAEARERLVAVRPRTLGQALRVSGVTPADVTVLMVHLGAAGRG
jgi:tRNA uridine 5-carboxymethylaminomethyl modification enzyme